MRQLISIILPIMICLMFSHAGAQVGLEKTPFWQSHEMGMNSTGMVWRDCNNDGYIDVFYSNGNDITLSPNTIYISDQGTLPVSASWFSSNQEYSGHCAVGDINEDGWPDFAVANYLGSPGFSTPNVGNLYLNNEGTINSDPDWYSADSFYSFSCAMGDADGDGDLDLAFATGEGYTHVSTPDYIYYNDGGTLQDTAGWRSDILTQGMDVAWGDVDNNGYLDLAFCYDDHPPSVFYNNGGVIETSPSWQALHNEPGNTIIFGDVNGDGWLDLIVANNYQLGGDGHFRVYFNDGSGNLDPQYGWQSATGDYGSALALYDCDQDGDLDLAAGRWWDPPRVYLNTGTTFTTTPVWQSDVSTVVEELAWVDVDGRGVISLADTFYNVSGKKVFYTEYMPLHTVDSVMVDGVILDYSDFCFDLFSGWVALSQIPSDSLIIYYRYSTQNDLAVANWDTRNMVYQYLAVSLSMESDEFSDLLGNGNGIPEAGETIELIITIFNSGFETASDVVVTLAIDDGSIIIADDYAYLGSINSQSSASNTSDPFSFDIPADYISRIDSFFLEISWNAGTEVDSFVIEKSIGKPTLLLVDDDNGDNLESYYRNSMSNYRIPNENWEVSSMGNPDEVVLGQYDLVIWYTGDYRADPLAVDAVAAMKDYMDAGGKLFLTGQAIAAQLSTSDPDFLANYLKSDYQSSSLIPVLEAKPGGQVFDSTTKIAIYGGGGASNQTLPDLLTVVNGGIPELSYLNQTDLGAVSYSGSYMMLFFGFGFESIASGDSRWRYRDSIFLDIVNYFDYPLPGSYPIVLAASVSPGNPLNMTDHTPDFGWTYYDPESAPQQGYHIQVGTDSDWHQAELWDTRPVSGSELTMTYSGLELEDGSTYYYRIQVYNGVLWSDWYADAFRMNSLPTIPDNLTPDNMQCDTSANPYLTHDNAFDAEFDDLTYSYRISDDSQFVNIVSQIDCYPEDPGSYTSWQVDIALADNHSYYWRVRAHDGFEDGSWSDPASFVINSTNQLPQPFGLLSPENGVTLFDPRPTFVWEAAFDPDPCDIITYAFLYDSDSLMADPIIVSDIDTTSFNVVEAFESGAYYWKAIAFDLYGGETGSNSIYTFIIGLRGDATDNGIVDVGDAVYIVNYIFRGGPPPDPYELGDANCDATVDVGDAVYLINYIFRDGPPPGCPK